VFYTPSSSGSQTITATSASAGTTGTFDLTVYGAANKLAFTNQPTNTTAGSTIDSGTGVKVSIEDLNGIVVSNSSDSVTIAIGTNPSSGTLSGTATVSAVNGVAIFSNLSINLAGTGYTLTATDSLLTNPNTTSSAFNITAGAANKLVLLQQPTNANGGATIAPAVTVQIQDSLGNLTASTASVTVAIGTNPTSGTLSGTKTVNAISGVATFSTLSVDKAGNGYTLTASSTGLTGATSSAFNISVGPAAKVAFGQQPTATTAGTAISPAVTVQVQDLGGNVVTTDSSNVTIAINGGGVLSGASTTTVAASSGVASFSNLVPTKSGTFTLTGTDGSLAGATSSSFTVSAASASKLVIAGLGTQTAGGSQNLTITAQDSFGNTATTYTGGHSLTFSGANASTNPVTNPTVRNSAGTAVTFGTATAITFTSGVATVSGGNNGAMVLYKAETATISATDGTISSSGAGNLTVVVSVAAANKLALLQQPTNTVAGASIAPAVTVQVQDAFGNSVTSGTGSTATVTVAIGTNPSSGTLSGTKTVAAVSGTATFSNLSINKSGSGYTLTENSTSPTLTGPASSAIC